MKIIYFATRGRVEVARLMMQLRGAPYEEEFVPLESWVQPQTKERFLGCTPFGQLPVLQDGEFTLCQSQAINRYLARKLELYGDTLEQSARIDEVAETAFEVLMDLGTLFWNPRFHEVRADHRAATAKKLERLEDYFIRTRADGDHWVVPGRYTLADAAMAYTLESFMPLHTGLVKEFPELYRAMTAFFAADGVREYVRGTRRLRTWTVSLASFGGKPEETHQWTD
ncbi:glutathione S-transferase family protein [Sorangium sp. So ce1182]|uniref:glutathione S-transferase family protein n=1 Tax=Sorangium sp. So ce1182 TaxID=3133334 RepID=UPI003F6436DD